MYRLHDRLLELVQLAQVARQALQLRGHLALLVHQLLLLLLAVSELHLQLGDATLERRDLCLTLLGKAAQV